MSASAVVFAEGGALARVVSGYEPREGQRRMAEAVAAVVQEGGTLLAEAGTGTGKTLAYLIPAILSRQRVLVSTGTKNLQEQIFFKDLPALRDALGIPFTATLMKGRSNYLCLHRWETYQDAVAGNVGGRLIDTGDHVLLPVIQEWAARTTTGDRAEIADLPEDLPMWKEVSAEADTCLGTDCPRYGECFVTQMRQRAAESDVVIVNHHLLCADASLRHHGYGEVIPACPTLVVDEAHQLEDVATQYFGVAISSYRIDEFVRDAERVIGDVGRGFAPRQTEDAARMPLDSRSGHPEGIRGVLARVQDSARIFFANLSLTRERHGLTEGRARYTADSMADHLEDGMRLAGALEGLEAVLAPGVPAEPGAETDPEQSEALAAIRRRAGELRSDLRRLLRADDPDFVYYAETRSAGTPSRRSLGGRSLFLRASPIDVSRLVRETVFDEYRSIILTSATLAIDGSFDYIKGRLGIPAADEVLVASEFDYARQTLLYLPRRMPPPKSPSFAEAAARETIELLKRSRGRAFVLFTSYAVLRTVQQFVEMTVPYPILVQGTAPRSALIEQFRDTPNAVLLATSSFWQGVDVAGEALSCVIVDKLPFASPGDPVVAARIDAIKERGGDAFAEYQVPLAILTLQQGLGRLIRHRSDRGVLAILDPRVRTMGYGRRFLASLPPAPVTHGLDAVEQFFM